MRRNSEEWTKNVSLITETNGKRIRYTRIILNPNKMICSGFLKKLLVRFNNFMKEKTYFFILDWVFIGFLNRYLIIQVIKSQTIKFRVWIIIFVELGCKGFIYKPSQPKDAFNKYYYSKNPLLLPCYQR